MPSLAEHVAFWKSWLSGASQARVHREHLRSLALVRAQGHVIRSFLEVAAARSLLAHHEQLVIETAFDDWAAAPFVTRLAVLSLFQELTGGVLEGAVLDATEILSDFHALVAREPADLPREHVH